MSNIRAAVLMVASMAGFAIEDSFIKALTTSWPTGQVMIVLGLAGFALFALMIRAKGLPLFPRAALHPMVLLRNAGEMIAALGFITAIALTPLSSAAAILQATPLAVTLGAALFLGEQVGWRRWMAITVGFLGVLLIVRPGLDGFQPASLFAVLAVFGLALRDLVTRRLPEGLDSIQVAGYGFLSIAPVGVVLLALSGGATAPDLPALLKVAGALVFGVSGYYAVVVAVRMGEVSFVMPFRYTRLLFALALGVAIFGERPDLPTLMGAALIVASGLYTLWRESRLGRRSQQPSTLRQFDPEPPA